MKRHWPLLLLLLVWSAVLAVPRTRDFVWTTIASWNLAVPGISRSDTAIPWSDPLLAPYQRLLVKFPQNRKVIVAQALDYARHGDLKPLESARRQFPDEPLLIAARVSIILGHGGTNRREGPLTNPNYPAKESPPPLKVDRRWEFEEVVALSRIGQKLAPGNSLFDWCLIHGLFGLRRDEEALDALSVGARKSGYDNYVMKNVQVRYDARKLERVPSLSEASWLLNSAANPYVSINRETGRLIMERVIEARGRRDKVSALQHSHNLLKMSRTMRLKATTWVDMFAGSSIESTAILSWQAITRGKRSPTRNLPDNMAGYAMAAGQPKLAQEVMDEWQVIQATIGIRPAYLQATCGVETPLFFGIQLLSQAAYFLFSASRWVLPIWFLLSFYLYICRPHVYPVEAHTSRRAFIWGGIVGLVTLILTIIADISVIFRQIELGWEFIFQIAPWFGGSANIARWWVDGFPGVILLWAALLLSRRRRGRKLSHATEFETAGLTDNPINKSVLRYFPQVAKWSLGLVICAALIGYFGFLPVNEENFRYSKELLLLFAAMLCLPQIIAIGRVRPNSVGFRWFLKNLRYTAAGYLTTIWFCLGLSILILLPVLHYFDAQFQQLLQVGEPQIVKALLGL